MIIYKATNKKSGNVYIGQTVNTLDIRKEQHIKLSKSKNTHFYNALRSYGETQFEWSVLASAKSKEELNELEIFYINEYDSIKNGYNMVEGGTGGYNEFAVNINRKKRLGKTYEEIYDKEMCKVVKEKLRKSAIKYNNFGNFTEEEKIKYSRMGATVLNNSGYTHSDETKHKISAAQIGISYEERYGVEKTKKLKKLISQKTKEGMAKLDMKELQRKAEIGKAKYWKKKHEDDRAKIIELKKLGYKIKHILSELDITTPTYYARMKEITQATIEK
jgi:group I intron endonuclease